MKRPLTKPERAATPKRAKAATPALSPEVQEIIARHDKEARDAGWTKEYVDRLAAEAFAHPETQKAIKRERARLAARRKTVEPVALQRRRGPARTA